MDQRGQKKKHRELLPPRQGRTCLLWPSHWPATTDDVVGWGSCHRLLRRLCDVFCDMSWPWRILQMSCYQSALEGLVLFCRSQPATTTEAINLWNLHCKIFQIDPLKTVHLCIMHLHLRENKPATPNRRCSYALLLVMECNCGRGSGVPVLTIVLNGFQSYHIINIIA